MLWFNSFPAQLTVTSMGNFQGKDLSLKVFVRDKILVRRAQIRLDPRARGCGLRFECVN